MLQVGNLKSVTEDKVHFSLWSILAAPIMAGNDLRKMSDEVKSIITAKEVLAINQDPRTHQGYRVYEKDSIEIYNKPLSDLVFCFSRIGNDNKGKPSTLKSICSVHGCTYPSRRSGLCFCCVLCPLGRVSQISLLRWFWFLFYRAIVLNCPPHPRRVLRESVVCVGSNIKPCAVVSEWPGSRVAAFFIKAIMGCS